MCDTEWVSTGMDNGSMHAVEHRSDIFSCKKQYVQDSEKQCTCLSTVYVQNNEAVRGGGGHLDTII